MRRTSSLDLPPALLTRFEGFVLKPIRLGESGAAVYRCSAEREPGRYLKTAPIAAGLHLDREAERLRWMKQRGLAVPTVYEYGTTDSTEYLVLDEVPGLAASDPTWVPLLPSVISALGEGLALLHRTGILDCPFDQRISSQIEAARVRLATGQVDEGDFDESRLGRRATDLFAELLASVPSHEDLVFTHGDYCLPNVLLRHSAPDTVQVSGFIDCGRAGIADRHQDLALAIRSISFNFGAEWVPTFLAAYGLAEPDADKVKLYTLLDEFF